MACIRVPNGIVCVGTGTIYDYHGIVFQLENRWGPWPVRRDNHEMCKNASDAFWRAYARFEKEKDKEHFAIEHY